MATNAQLLGKDLIGLAAAVSVGAGGDSLEITANTVTPPTNTIADSQEPQLNSLSTASTIVANAGRAGSNQLDYLFRMVFDDPVGPVNAVHLIGFNYQITTGVEPQFRLKFLQKGTTTLLDEWGHDPSGLGQGSAIIQTDSASGLAVGDYVTIDQDFFEGAGGGPEDIYIYIPRVKNHPWPVHAVNTPQNQFTIFDAPGIESDTFSPNDMEMFTGSPDPVVTRWTAVHTATLTPGNPGAIQSFVVPGITFDAVLLEYDRSAANTGIMQVDRVMAGDWFIPAKNCQPRPFTPVNRSEGLEMADGSLRYEDTNPQMRSRVIWKTLTQAEGMTLQDICTESGRKKPVFLSMFPNDTDSAWEARGQLYGIIKDWDFDVLVENESEYYMSGMIEIEGVVIE